MNTDGTGFHTCKECHKTEFLWNHTTTDHKEENNWKTKEALARAAVTVETERIKGSNPWCLWWWWWWWWCTVPIIHTIRGVGLRHGAVNIVTRVPADCRTDISCFHFLQRQETRSSPVFPFRLWSQRYILFSTRSFPGGIKWAERESDSFGA